MNPNQAIQPSHHWLAALSARAQGVVDYKANRLTIGGIVLLLIGLAVFFSGLGIFRVRIFNLRLQPYLLLVAAGGLPLAIGRLPKFPMKVLVGLLLFWTLYAISMVGPASARITPLEEAFKLAMGIMVIVTVALLVSSRADFVLGSLGLCLGIGALAAYGLAEEEANIIEVANKNSYSMYALPAVLLAIYVAVRVDWNKVSGKGITVLLGLASSLIAALAIVSGGNRSGYLGLALIALMIGLHLTFSRRFGIVGKSRGMLLLACMVVAVITGLVYKGAEIFQQRVEQTFQGDESNTLRMQLFTTAVEIGFENPVRGVSPQQLPLILARRLHLDASPDSVRDTHNVFGNVIGGCGLITTAVLLYIGWALFFWRPGKTASATPTAGFLEARALLRMMVVLWAVRGLFSEEILYNPGFCIGLGLAIGLCIVELEVMQKTAPFGVPAMGQLPAAIGPRQHR